MKTFSRIESGLVAELIELPDDMDPSEIFAPELEVVAVPAGVGVHVGYRYEAGVFAAPGATPAPHLNDLKAALVVAATEKRWSVETGGVTLPGGLRVASAKADQDRITSVVVNAAAAGVESVDFKAESGWQTLTLAQVQAVASAVALHVQACFSAERAHHVAIAALSTVAAAQVYDMDAGWPG